MTGSWELLQSFTSTVHCMFAPAVDSPINQNTLVHNEIDTRKHASIKSALSGALSVGVALSVGQLLLHVKGNTTCTH